MSDEVFIGRISRLKLGADGLHHFDIFDDTKRQGFVCRTSLRFEIENRNTPMDFASGDEIEIGGGSEYGVFDVESMTLAKRAV